jgi:hypothetical protein
MRANARTIRNPEARLLDSLGKHYINILLRNDRARLASLIDTTIVELLTDIQVPNQVRVEVRSDLDSVLSQLPDRCRSVLRLRYGLGYSAAETAAQTGYRASSIGKITHRCLAALSRVLLQKTAESAPTAYRPEVGRPRQQQPGKEAAIDLLVELRSVVAATADLRTASGRLSARKVADTFGLPLAELSRLLKRSRQAVSKTADAESLQPALASFEGVARLRAILSEDDFRRWLRMPNDQLDNLSPLDVIRGGQAGEIADLVEDMLTGNAT